MSDSHGRVSVPTRDTPEPAWPPLVPAPETREFLASARAQLGGLFPFARLRGLLDGAEPGIGGWTELVESGYTSIGLPEESGGFGSALDLAAVLEEAGRALLPVPLLSTAASAQTLLLAGMDADGATPAGLAIANAGASAPEVLEVLDGALIEELTLLRRDGTGVAITRLRLEPRMPAAIDPVDPSRPLVAVPLAGATPLAEGRIDGASLDDALAPARICAAADLVGVAALALDGGIAHALVREQFGRPIGSFQAVKHLLANCYVGIERARSLTLGAAVALAADPGSPELLRLSLLAKAAASDAALRSTALQVQLFGAMGLTFEADAPLAVRRAQQTARWLGTVPELYARAGAGFLASGAVDD